MHITTYIVDSFTDEPFKGNPAGVCIVESQLTDQVMLSIAQELGLSETAFITKKEETGTFSIRYFSPVMEIPLCGHATLAASEVVFSIDPDRKNIEFINVQGIRLQVQQENGLTIMKFPLYSTRPDEAPAELLKSLGIEELLNVAYNDETKILLIEINDSRLLRKLQPNFEALKASHDSINGVLVTAKSYSNQYDFESRYFWPWSGTNEDPVTGGTHTFLTPYWSKRLNKKAMRSFQCSKRTGQMEVEIIDENWFYIKSTARIVFQGTLKL